MTVSVIEAMINRCRYTMISVCTGNLEITSLFEIYKKISKLVLE